MCQGVQSTPLSVPSKSHSLQKPPSPITHPVMSPSRPQHCGDTWRGDDVLRVSPLQKGHQPEDMAAVAAPFTQQTAGVKPPKWEHSSSGDARKDKEA